VGHETGSVNRKNRHHPFSPETPAFPNGFAAGREVNARRSGTPDTHPEREPLPEPAPSGVGALRAPYRSDP